MRRIILLLLFFIAIGADAQIYIRCMATITKANEPLYVIDGVPVGKDQINALDPNEIESIDILKDAAATAIYGCRAGNGVVLITMKRIAPKFIIKDKINGEAIEGATVWLGYKNGMSNVMILKADKEGVAASNPMRKNTNYSIEVTCVGYKTYNENLVNADSSRTVYLERDIKTCEAVTVKSSSIICKCRRTCCGYSTTCTRHWQIMTPKIEAAAAKLYPNPAIRSQYIFIEPGNKTSSVRIVNNAGIALKTEKISEGKMSIQLPASWPAGIYYVQFLDDKSKQIETRKLIVQ